MALVKLNELENKANSHESGKGTTGKEEWGEFNMGRRKERHG